jgi:small-conductance mechanosensitive channel
LNKKTSNTAIQIINISSDGLIMEGRIKHVNLLDTVLINQNNAAFFIPNSGLFKNSIIKNTAIPGNKK